MVLSAEAMGERVVYGWAMDSPWHGQQVTGCYLWSCVSVFMRVAQFQVWHRRARDSNIGSLS